jgi:hypothetical protein
VSRIAQQPFTLTAPEFRRDTQPVRLRGWWVLSLACLSNSCGSGTRAKADAGVGGVPNVPDGVEPIESFEADRIAAVCATRVRCHDTATVDGCIKATMGLMSPQIVADVRAGITNYDPHLGYRCIQLALVTPCFGPPWLEACRNAFTGTLPGGAACTLSTQCASRACTPTNCGADCCPGTCSSSAVAARGIPLGGGCGPGTCDDGLDCVSGSCTAEPGVGEMCGNGRTCQTGLRCDSSLGPACARLSGLGEQCATTDCDEAVSFCDSTTRICRAPPAIDDPCTGVVECGRALNCVNGACAVPGVVGDPCAGPNGSVIQCQQGHDRYGFVECMSGICDHVVDPTLPCASP